MPETREVLIHLNITVVAERDDMTYVNCLMAAQNYLRDHDIPADDVALIDPQ